MFPSFMEYCSLFSLASCKVESKRSERLPRDCEFPAAFSALSSHCALLPQVGLAVVNGQLMAVGGFDGTTYLKTIEVFDPDANTWR